MADESQKKPFQPASSGGKPESSMGGASAPPPGNIPVEPKSSGPPTQPRPQPPPAPQKQGVPFPPSGNRPKIEVTPSSVPPQGQQDRYKEPIRPAVVPFEPTQKKALLKRGEVRTMQKDVNDLREQETRKEQERIAQLKAQEDVERERSAVQKIRQTAEVEKKQEESQKKEELKRIQDSILPPGEERRVQGLPKRPSSGKKVFIRVVIVIIFAFIALNAALFAYWFFFQNQSIQIPFLSQEDSVIEQEPSPTPPTDEPSPLPEPTPQPAPTPIATPAPLPNVITSLINPTHTSTFEFSSAQGLASLLEQFLQDSQATGFTQLLFRNTGDQTFVEQANDFLGVFARVPPSAVVPHISQDTLFFSYATERGNRFGMIVQLADKEAATQAFREWEPGMEESLSSVMPFWGQQGSGYTTTFRSTTHQGVDVRFQTFSTQDYGIVYAQVGNYLVLASSFDATKAAIETLQASTGSISQPKVLASLGEPENVKPPPTLSFEQAIGQVLMMGFNDAKVTPELKDTMKRLQPGGVLLLSRNIQSAEQLKQLTQDLQEISLEYSKLPLFIAVDQEGGDISRIEFGKEKTPQSAIESADHAYVVGQARGQELKSLGVNVNLSPVLDITQAGDFLFERTFQTEIFETGEFARALLTGQQNAGILSSVKHFPGYGSISFNPEQKLAIVQEFPDTSPFVSTFVASPEFVLLSNVVYTDFDPDNPFTFSEKGIRVLRDELGFQGVILSDDLVQPSLLNNYSFEQITSLPLEAGTNMVMFSEQSYAIDAHRILVQAAAQNPALKKKIEDSAAKILEVKKQFFFESNQSLALDQSFWNK